MFYFIRIDRDELSLEYVHKDLGDPTNRQVFDIHHAVFKDSKMQATQKIIEDYFMNLDVNIDNVSNGKNVNRITKLLRDQGIELKEDTVRKKMRSYQKSLSYISIKSDFQKQKIFYKNLINELDLAEKQNRTRDNKDDLIEVAESYFLSFVKNFKGISKDLKLFKKILNQSSNLPYPGDLKNIIKTSLAFSDQSNGYDYLRRGYNAIIENIEKVSLAQLKDQGFTLREIEKLKGESKSTVARKLNRIERR